MAPPPPPRAPPPPRPTGTPPPRPTGPPPSLSAPPRPSGTPPPRPSVPPPPTQSPAGASSIGAPPPRPSVPPPPRSVPPPPRAPPPKPDAADNAPGATTKIPGPPTSPPPRDVPGPPSGPPPPRPPTGAPPGPPSGPPPKKKNGLPGPPPGAPPAPPPGPPPQPPKDPPPTKQPTTGDSGDNAVLPRGVIERMLKRGRINFKLLEARGLRNKGGTEKKFSADPYVKIHIGIHPLSMIELKSKTLKKCTSTVIFHEEIVAADLVKPETLIHDGDVPIKLEIFDENLISDELIGEARFSALRFFDGKPHKEILPLTLKSGEECGELELEIKLDIALVGMISIVLLEGRNLKSMELIGKQDPYCKLAIGQYSKRGKTVKKGGRNPYFGEEELLFWITDELWVNKMHLSVYDEDIGSDDLIGEAQFSVLHFMQNLGQQDHAISLKNSGQNAGDIIVKIEFFPAGVLQVQCLAGRNLRSVDAIGRQDPYVKFTVEGKATKALKKTKTDTDGGREPEWEDEIFTFEIVDQYNMLVEVWDADSIGNDDLIGATTISLLPIFRYGFVDDWLKLWVKDEFWGPNGVAYPQHQIGMDKFTEKERLTKETIGQPLPTDEDESTTPSNAAADAKLSALSAPTKAKPVVQNDSEFSEEEILGAFRFLDLDKNNFIGAAELRHLLICMGELITDEEIDEMIKLCDLDGDGQVSFDEFRRMVIHPDPGSPEFAIAKLEDDESGDVDVKLITKELTPERKIRLLEIKEEKKRLLKRFVDDNNPNLDLLTRIAMKFRAMHRGDDDLVDFDDFCMLFEIEPTGEYRRLFTLHTSDAQSPDEGGDLREILLGIVNFMEATDRQQRVKFCFELFDDDHNGFITEDELVNILKANHLTTEDQVRKKAATILRQANDNGDGRMSLDEFSMIAKKFPNLLFPSYDAAGKTTVLGMLSQKGGPFYYEIDRVEIVDSFLRPSKEEDEERQEEEMATVSSTLEMTVASSTTEVKHLADRLNTAQVKLKRLARLETAIVDFFMEVMDRTASLPTSQSPQTAPKDESTFAKNKRKEECLKKAEGDPISVLNALRTHLRVQFTAHDQYHHDMRQTIKKLEISGERNAHDSHEEIRRWEVACEKAQHQMHALAQQLSTTQDDHDRTTRQYKRTLEQLNHELHALHAASEAQCEQLAKRQTDVDELKRANEVLAKDRKRVTDELARTGDHLRTSGGSPLTLAGGMSTGGSSGLIGFTPAEQQNLKRVLQDYECKLSRLESTNDELRQELQQQQQHLASVKQSTQAQHCFKLEKDVKKLRETLDIKTKSLADQEAELLRTRGNLKEKETLIQDMKDEYNKLFTAMQKIKQTPSHARPITRSSSSTRLFGSNNRSPSRANSVDKKSTNDHAISEVPASHMRAQANENPYLLEHYKATIEQQEKEIARLHNQLRKMIASEYRHKQKNKLFRVERVQLKDTCDNLRGELERAVKTTAKAMAQQIPFFLEAERDSELSRSISDQHLRPEQDDQDLQPSTNQLCCSIADLRRLKQRNQYLEARFRSGTENLLTVIEKTTTTRPPRPSSSSTVDTGNLRTSSSTASILESALNSDRSIDATTMLALQQVKRNVRARPQSAGPRARLDSKSSSLVTKSLL